MRKLMTILAAMSIAVMSADLASAWDPQRPIELTNPFSAGGDSDLSGRAAMEAAQQYIKQPLITVNRPGAGGAIGYQHIISAPPDGHSLVWTSGSLLTAVNTGNLPF